MSVYSGFSTRQQEVTYNRLTETLLLLLQDRLLSAQHHGEGPVDQFWLEQFMGVYTQMSRMEMHKYFPPKLTQCVRDLATTYGATGWDEPLSLSSERKHKNRTAQNYHRSVSPHKDTTLLMPEVPVIQDFLAPVTARPRRKKRAKKPKKQDSPGKYTIEWADMQPKSRNYYNGLLLKKLTKPKVPQTRLGNTLRWKEF